MKQKSGKNILMIKILIENLSFNAKPASSSNYEQTKSSFLMFKKNNKINLFFSFSDFSTYSLFST